MKSKHRVIKNTEIWKYLKKSNQNSKNSTISGSQSARDPNPQSNSLPAMSLDEARLIKMPYLKLGDKIKFFLNRDLKKEDLPPFPQNPKGKENTISRNLAICTKLNHHSTSEIIKQPKCRNHSSTARNAIKLPILKPICSKYNISTLQSNYSTQTHRTVQKQHGIKTKAFLTHRKHLNKSNKYNHYNKYNQYYRSNQSNGYSESINGINGSHGSKFNRVLNLNYLNDSNSSQGLIKSQSEATLSLKKPNNGSAYYI
jgi:hypothetical protein